MFEIIAEPNRRAILSLLVSSPQSVGEIARQLRMPQPSVSKHLREAGFVESTVDAQRRLYRLKPVGRIVAGQAMKFGWPRLNSEYAWQFGIEVPSWPPKVAQS